MSDETPGTDTLLAELAEAAGVSDSAPDDAMATPDTVPDPSPDADDQAPDAESVSSTPDAPASTEAPPTLVFDPEKHLALDGASPFAFRVDGRHVAPDGALRLSDGRIVFPEATWNRQMHGLLADRAAIKEREAQYRERVQQAEAGRAEWEAEKAAYAEELAALFGDWDKIAAAKDRWEVEGPRRVAELKAKALERRLSQIEEQRSAEARRQAEEALTPQLEQYLSDKVGEWLGEAGIHPDQQGKYPETWVQWWTELLEDHGIRGFYQRGPGNQVELNQDKAFRLFQRHLTRSKAQQATTQAATKKAQVNAAAVAPPKAKPPGPGKPAAPGQAPAKPATRKHPEGPFDAQAWLAGRSYTDEE